MKSIMHQQQTFTYVSAVKYFTKGICNHVKVIQIYWRIVLSIKNSCTGTMFELIILMNNEIKQFAAVYWIHTPL